MVINFDSKIFGQSKPVQAQNTTGTDGIPNWGLSDPQSLSEVSCFGIFVGGEESEMSQDSCNTTSGTKISFGPRAGFFGIGQNGVIEVPSGSQRKFYLAAMASADGTCQSDFATNPDINFSNHSPPFIIGEATADLAGSEVTIEIPLVNTFNDSNRIADCNFISDDDSGNTPVGLTLQIPESKRMTWADDEDGMRTIQFTHSGESVDCSKDAGATFTSCTTDNSFMWDDADKDIDHHIRVLYSDGSTEEAIFNPATHYPGLNFVTCGIPISTSSDYTGVSTPFATTSAVICFDNGVTISDSVTPPSMADNITLLARHGDTVIIENTSTTQNTIDVDSQSNFKLVGIRLESNGTGGVSALRLNDVTNVYIEDSEIIMNGLGYGIYAIETATSTALTIDSSQIEALAGGYGIKAGFANTTVTVNNSSIKSTGTGIDVATNASVSVYSSTIESSGATGELAQLFGNSNVLIQYSELYDGTGKGIQIDCNISALTATLDISDNLFVRVNSAGSGNATAIQSSGNGACTETINSTTNGNLFCHENPAITFTSITDYNEDGGTFASTAQLNGPGATIGTCP